MKANFTGKYGLVIISGLVVLVMMIGGFYLFGRQKPASPNPDQISNQPMKDDQGGKDQAEKDQGKNLANSYTEIGETKEADLTSVDSQNPPSSPATSDQVDKGGNLQEKADKQGDNHSSSNTESSPSNSEPEANNPPSSLEMEAEKYYRESGTLLEIIDASQSTSVPTEAEVVSLLEERGFTDVQVTYDYEMGGGDYPETKEITGDALAKRPLYQFFYRTKGGYPWNILIINGDIFANPLPYNLVSTRPAELFISERREITGYDSDTNKYYIIIPKESSLIIKVIDVINAESLEKLTNEEIDKL